MPSPQMPFRDPTLIRCYNNYILAIGDRLSYVTAGALHDCVWDLTRERDLNQVYIGCRARHAVNARVVNHFELPSIRVLR